MIVFLRNVFFLSTLRGFLQKNRKKNKFGKPRKIVEIEVFFKKNASIFLKGIALKVESGKNALGLRSIRYQYFV